MGSVLEKVLLAFFKMYMFIKLFSYKKNYTDYQSLL